MCITFLYTNNILYKDLLKWCFDKYCYNKILSLGASSSFMAIIRSRENFQFSQREMQCFHKWSSLSSFIDTKTIDILCCLVPNLRIDARISRWPTDKEETHTFSVLLGSRASCIHLQVVKRRNPVCFFPHYITWMWISHWKC